MKEPLAGLDPQLRVDLVVSLFSKVVGVVAVVGVGGRSFPEEALSCLRSRFCLFSQVWRKSLRVASQERSIKAETERTMRIQL